MLYVLNNYLVGYLFCRLGFVGIVDVDFGRLSVCYAPKVKVIQISFGSC